MAMIMNKKGIIDLSPLILIFILLASIGIVLGSDKFFGINKIDCCQVHGYEGYSFQYSTRTCYNYSVWHEDVGRYDRIYVPYVDVCGDS